MATQAAVAAAVSSAPPRVITVAAVQFACSTDVDGNCRRAETLIRDAARKGANIILLQELFASLYFPIDQMDCMRLAVSIDDDKSYILRFQSLARELSVVLPISFYERANNAYFNSVVVIDADGSQLGIYRKSHIPDGPGYQEKFYFSPGDTGFRTFKTRYACIGLGICWDQWFPEAARCMALQNADLLMYPTAIGTEPQDPALDTCAQWQRCMQGHAAANMVPVIAANRVGKEMSVASDVSITFYGSSFMTDHTGAIVSDAGRHQETILFHTYNIDEIRTARHSWGIFRDRRPDLYTALFSFDGSAAHIGMDRRSSLHSAFPGPRVNVGPAPVTVPGLAHPKKVGDPETLVAPHQMVPVVDDTRRGGLSNTFDLHEASFIGDVKASAQRRPRGRCWVCRAKTTYECKLCSPGPVPLCNRTARECWWKYHAGEITPFVPNKRGRKRRKTDHGEVHENNAHEPEESEDHVEEPKPENDPANVGALLG
eukprot:GFKZ01010066.1.p1 GENE.GFKZ01010066.1~~GFKZ01010066.1.p1  ORF type:complete len:486 (+),score=41.81 GFKZ01010066.1:333-1790(+)